MGAGTATGPGRIRAGEAVRDHGFVRVWPDDGPIMPPRIALEHAARCLSVEDLAILLESAANARLLSVGELLVIECDSHGHHEDPRAYANDRRRDQQLLLLGYRVLRLTWEDVMLNWPRAQELLRRIIALELHRAPRNRRGLAGR